MFIAISGAKLHIIYLILPTYKTYKLHYIRSQFPYKKLIYLIGASLIGNYIIILYS